MRLDTTRARSFLHLLFEWSKRDFRIRYTQTLLGSIWAFVQPIALTAAFVFIFGHVAKIQVGVPYASFVFPGMLVWALFSTGISNATSATVGSLYIAAKAKYPRMVAPVSAAMMPLTDLAAGLVLLAPLVLIQHAPGRFQPLPILLSLIGVLVFAIGVGTFLSALTIFIRDVTRVVPLALQLGLLVTPVAYPAHRLPGWLAANPMATFVRGFRSGFIRASGPSLTQWVIAMCVAGGACLLGAAYYHRVESRFPDVA